MNETVQVPSRLVQKWVEVSAELGELQDELEDFLISRNPQLLRKLREARREHLAGKIRPYDDLARTLGLLPRSSLRRPEP